MEPALDEASLIPCENLSPGQRIDELAATLRALDQLGAPRVLRYVHSAADIPLLDGQGLRLWCFDRQTPRDAGRFVAQRLGKAPYIDGADGLFAALEGTRAIDPTIQGARSLGGGQVALTDGVLVQLKAETSTASRPVVVRLEIVTETEAWTEDVPVDAVDCAGEVGVKSDPLRKKIEAAVRSGAALVAGITELFPRLVLGERAAAQISELKGSEQLFPQLLRHLRVLDRAALAWTRGRPFAPEGVGYSVESEGTLKHGTLGPLRDFPTPANFGAERWTLHTKLSGVSAPRLYFKMREDDGVGPNGETVRCLRIAIGYVGPHLPTVNFR